MAEERGERILPVSIEDEMKTAYIDYSMSVIVSRALPDVRVRYVPGGHMGVITRSSEVMPHLADWLKG